MTDLSLILGELKLSKGEFYKMVLNSQEFQNYLLVILGTILVISLIISVLIELQWKKNLTSYFMLIVIPLVIVWLLFMFLPEWDKFSYWFEKLLLNKGVN